MGPKSLLVAALRPVGRLPAERGHQAAYGVVAAMALPAEKPKGAPGSEIQYWR